jgi:hypothetical protein
LTLSAPGSDEDDQSNDSEHDLPRADSANCRDTNGDGDDGSDKKTGADRPHAGGTPPFCSEDLNGNLAAQARIPRAVDLAHAAGAERAQDLGATESRAL